MTTLNGIAKPARSHHPSHQRFSRSLPSLSQSSSVMSSDAERYNVSSIAFRVICSIIPAFVEFPKKTKTCSFMFYWNCRVDYHYYVSICFLQNTFYWAKVELKGNEKHAIYERRINLSDEIKIGMPCLHKRIWCRLHVGSISMFRTLC